MRLQLLPNITKSRLSLIGIFVVCLVFAGCAAATATPSPTPIPTPIATPTTALDTTDSATTGTGAFAVLKELLEELGPRASATEQELAAARYLESRYREILKRFNFIVFSTPEIEE